MVDIFGTKKNIHANLHNSVVITYGGKTDMGKGIASLYARENLQRSFRILTDTSNAAVNFIQGKHRGIPTVIRKFMDSVQNGAEPPVTAEDGKRGFEGMGEDNQPDGVSSLLELMINYGNFIFSQSQERGETGDAFMFVSLLQKA